MQYPLTFEQYQEGLRNGKVLGLECRKCKAVTFPSQILCGTCGCTDLSVVEMKGEGTVRSFTVARVAPEGLKPPYIVAMVELDEGPWITGNLSGQNPEEAKMDLIGRKVRLGSRPYAAAPGDDEKPHVLTFKVVE